MTPPTLPQETTETPYEMATEAAMAIASIIGTYRHVYGTESGLRPRISAMLQAAGVDHECDAPLPGIGRIDLLAGLVGIVVDTGGSVRQVHRQLTEHARSNIIDALVLVTVRRRHGALLPPDASGKPVVVVQLPEDFATGDEQ